MSYFATILGQSARARQLNAKLGALRRNQQGSIEGLPLYFLVSAVVVAVAMSALLSMMGGMQGQTLGGVDTDRDSIRLTSGRGTAGFNVTVTDTNGRPIEGATVTVEGLGASAARKTDGAGHASFNVTVDLGTAAFGELDVQASFSGPVGEGHRHTTLLITRQ